MALALVVASDGDVDLHNLLSLIDRRDSKNPDTRRS